MSFSPCPLRTRGVTNHGRTIVKITLIIMALCVLTAAACNLNGDNSEWQVVQNHTIDKCFQRIVNGEWMEEKTFDMQDNLVQHRYWDWLHRMHTVDYQDGEVVLHEIRE